MFLYKIKSESNVIISDFLYNANFKPDFKDKHADLRKSWYPEVGLPEPDHFIIMKHTSERNFIWQRAKKLGTDDSPIEEFTKELAEYICNRN